MRRRSLEIAFVILCIVVAFFLVTPRLVDESQNKILKKPPYPASERALTLHPQLTIADLHADSLCGDAICSNAASMARSTFLAWADGNVALQVFSLPTKSPSGLNIESNEDKHDQILWLAMVDRWPPQTWNSLTQRALYQAAVCINSPMDLKAALSSSRVRPIFPLILAAAAPMAN